MTFTARDLFFRLFLALLVYSTLSTVVLTPILAQNEPVEVCFDLLGDKTYHIEVTPKYVPTSGVYTIEFSHIWPPGDEQTSFTWDIYAVPKVGTEKATGEKIKVEYIGKKHPSFNDAPIFGATKTIQAATSESGVMQIKMVDPTGKYVCSGKSNEFQVGSTAFKQPDVGKETNTFFGTIKAAPADIASKFLSIGVGIAGGVAFLLMVFGSYRLMFAGGNPESIQQGREIITAAIAGLIVIVFSVFILRLIGISILGLPL